MVFASQQRQNLRIECIDRKQVKCKMLFQVDLDKAVMALASQHEFASKKLKMKSAVEWQKCNEGQGNTTRGDKGICTRIFSYTRNQQFMITLGTHLQENVSVYACAYLVGDYHT